MSETYEMALSTQATPKRLITISVPSS